MEKKREQELVDQEAMRLYDSMMKEFRNILDMLKHNFYKEEYLP